eukprot:6184426-Pleurochrysis_carterae.AAC.2
MSSGEMRAARPAPTPTAPPYGSKGTPIPSVGTARSLADEAAVDPTLLLRVLVRVELGARPRLRSAAAASAARVRRADCDSAVEAHLPRR